MLSWMNAARVLGEGENFTDIMKTMEIASAVRDSVTGEWSVTNLTNDVVADLSPQVAVAADGTAMVFWMRSPSGSPFDAANTPMQLWGVRYAEGSWSIPECVVADAGAVVGFDFVYDGTSAAIVCVSDADGDFSTANDFAVLAASWRNGTWDTSTAMKTGLSDAGSPIARLGADGVSFAIWTEDGILQERAIRGSGASSNAVVYSERNMTIPRDARPIRGADGSLALVWAEQMDDGFSTRPVVMPRDSATGAWGGPVGAEAFDGYQARNISGAFCTNGILHLSWENVSVSTNAFGEAVFGISEIHEKELSVSADPAILASDWAFGVADTVPGAETPIVVKVRNLGLQTATNVAVRMFVRDGTGVETELANASGSAAVLDLPGGAVASVTNLWICNDSLTDLTFWAEISTSTGSADVDASNNESEWHPGVPDLWLENARTVVETSDIRLLTVTVRNFGLGQAPEGTLISFRRGAPDGAEIGADTIGVVLPGELNGYDAGVTWDMTGAVFTSAWETVYAVIDTGNAEVDVSRAVPMRVATALDTDRDGLLDSEEERLGTNVFSSDTNGDSISDYDHIYTIFTSPVVTVPSTRTTPVPIPCEWLDNYPAMLSFHNEDYESFGNAISLNGRKVWECFMLGVDPTKADDDFKITRFWMENGEPKFEFSHSADGAGNSFVPRIKTFGKEKLSDSWQDVPPGGNELFRFFTVEVELP